MVFLRRNKDFITDQPDEIIREYGLYTTYLHNGQEYVLGLITGEPTYYGAPNFEQFRNGGSYTAVQGNYELSQDNLIVFNKITNGGWFQFQKILNGTPNTFDSLMVSPCQTSEPCDFSDFCFRYIPFPEIPDSLVHVFTPKTCEEIAASEVKKAINEKVYDYVQNKISTFEESYKQRCANPDNINDQFWLEYDLGYHHYTLYSYDRVGNLKQTIPPQGVDLLDIDAPNDNFDQIGMNRSTVPHHRYATDYQYNSLGQLIKQSTPDGGITDFYYNNIGQLRFSQNAQQKADATYSYTKYDELGRITEVGLSTQAIANNQFITQNNINNNLFPDNSAHNTEVTHTIYTTPADVTYLNDGVTEQRYLQNRISYTYTDEDGDPAPQGFIDDRTYTYYSYAPHGNVEWMIQDIPGFVGKQYLRYEYDLVSGNVLKVAYNETRSDQFYHRYSYDGDNRIILAETSTNNVTWEKDAGYQYHIHGPLQRTEIGEDKIQGQDYVYTLQGWLKALNHASLSKTKDPGHDGTNNFAKDLFAMQLGYFTGDFNRDNSPFNSQDTEALNPEESRDLYNGNISTWASNNLQHPMAEDPFPGLTGYQFQYDELNRIRTANFKQNVKLEGFQADPSFSTRYRYDANGNLFVLNKKGHSGGGLDMDNLQYHYYNKAGNDIFDQSSLVPEHPSNKLAYVNDFAAGGDYDDDLETQQIGNYRYDKIGNLVTDASEDIGQIKWTVYGKVREIIRTPGSSKPLIKFMYDAAGNRIAKIVAHDPENPAEITSTWYSREYW